MLCPSSMPFIRRCCVPSSSEFASATSRPRTRIGALALSGRRPAAEKLAEEAWREASDSFNTNEAFSIIALGVCETIVLSALRHELALGNRSLLEPIDPSLLPRAAAVPPVALEGADQLVSALRILALCLRDASRLPGAFRDRFQQHAKEIRALVSDEKDKEEEMIETDIFSLSECIHSVESAAEEVESMVKAPALADTRLMSAVRPLVSTVLALAAEVQSSDPFIRARRRILAALCTVESCLRSCIVERPKMTRSLFEGISRARQAVGHLRSKPPFDECEHSRAELPFEELVVSIRARIDEADRELSSVSDETDPEFVASARECVALTRALIPLPGS